MRLNCLTMLVTMRLGLSINFVVKYTYYRQKGVIVTFIILNGIKAGCTVNNIEIVSLSLS